MSTLNKYLNVLDNKIYTWGLSESGRLGMTTSDKGRGPGSHCFALPRPIFGSLHNVSDLSAKHWHSIIVAGTSCVFIIY